MTRLRSPNYPSMSLPDAVARTKVIYEKEFTNQASREVMIKAMGYSGINGASAVAFSALTKYGLVASTGNDQYKVTDEALNIFLYPRGERVRIEAIERAAFTPQLFAELREQYPGVLPSDENLNAYLVKRGFNPRSVSDLIRSYRETIEFVSSEIGHPPALVTNPIELDRTQSEVRVRTDDFESGQNFEGSDLSFKISRDSIVKIRFSGPVTQEAIEKLVSLLNLSKDVYPTAAEIAETDKSSSNSD